MSPSNDHAERLQPHKATLFCPNCPHESHITGDWIVQVHASALDYECPECGYTIQSRSAEPNMITPA